MRNAPIVRSVLTALSLAWELGYVIALPLVILAWFGRWLDRRWASSPWMLLLGIGIAFIITTIWLAIKIKEVTQDLGRDSNGPDNKQ